MATAGTDGVYRTDPLYTTRASHAADAPDEPDWSTWTAQIFDAVGEALGELTGPLQQRVKALEMQLAAANGALDVLRGKGVPGCFHVKGTFDRKTTYNYLDVVASDGASWVATRDNPGGVPGGSDDWQLLARQGHRGVAGERGPAGPAGAAPRFIGAGFTREGMQVQTSAGPISLFKSVTVDPEHFALKFTAGDDSTLTINLLPLFEAYREQTSD